MTQTQALRKENTTPVSLLSSKGRSRAAPVFRNGPRRFCYLPVLFDTTSQTGGRSTGLRLAPHMGIAPLRGSLRAAPTCYDGSRQKPLQRSTLWPDRSIAPTGGHGHTRSRRVIIAAVSRSLSAETKRRQKINIRCSLVVSSGRSWRSR